MAFFSPSVLFGSVHKLGFQYHRLGTNPRGAGGRLWSGAIIMQFRLLTIEFHGD
jgi:hypothetical protein